jgi:hypothetical protein
MSHLSAEREFLKVYIEYNKSKDQFKMAGDQRVLQLEEFLKKRIKFSPTEAIYLFVKEQRKLMAPNRPISDYASPTKELRLVVRKTDSF